MIKIKEGVKWVGKIDWELKKFHGEEYSIHRGSSYNSYLIEDEKTALIDTVWRPFAKEFVSNLKKEIDLKKIDYVIANHGEIDHSGALPELLEEIPDVPLYCTQAGVKSLQGHYHKNWNFKTVKTGDKLSLGKKELVFIEAKMLHWPDTMFSYLTKDNILFSNDAFGQHYACEFMFNDLADQCELYQEAVKYYANILTPFSMLVKKKIEEVLALNLPVDIIAPSHGIIWRDNPLQIVEQYKKWAENYQENQITIVYDTMWEGTKKMAEAIAKGILSGTPDSAVKLFNVGKSDKNDIMTEVFKSKVVLAGSSTINRGILTGMAAFLEEVKGLGFKNKKAAAFGCYGWSGESADIISEELKKCGFDIAADPLKNMWMPDDENIEKCVSYGKGLALKLK